MTHKYCNKSNLYPACKTRLEQQLTAILTFSKIHIKGWETHLAQWFYLNV